MSLHNRIESMWWEPSTPPLVLRLAEPIYAAISKTHLNRRAANAIEPLIPMISVGNITAGGSGKTPFVLWLAGFLKLSGFNPVILCRGDGGKNKTPVLVTPESEAAVVGDEAKMLSDISGCPVISAADRIRGCLLAAEFGDVLILDDGFQYRHLKRCCDIVLIPGAGVGNGHRIPAGPLREPVEALARADIIVRTGNQAAVQSSTPLSDKKEWRWATQAVGLVDAMHTGAEQPDTLFAVTAIARPQRFFDDLKSSGVHVADCKAFPDHYAFTEKDIAAMLEQPADIAVTAKDAVKLAPLWPDDRPLWLLHMQGVAEDGLGEAITACLPQTKNPATRDGVS